MTSSKMARKLKFENSLKLIVFSKSTSKIMSKRVFDICCTTIFNKDIEV